MGRQERGNEIRNTFAGFWLSRAAFWHLAPDAASVQRRYKAFSWCWTVFPSPGWSGRFRSSASGSLTAAGRRPRAGGRFRGAVPRSFGFLERSRGEKRGGSITLTLEPFYTTKHTENASGLGLAMVQPIARQHGDFVDLRSEPRTGSFSWRSPSR
ncbi:MAG: hypothetical protein NT080_02350 [Spirochaetes bacterium]|nr:hypothetical protein [Spirochaetota bacterium]